MCSFAKRCRGAKCVRFSTEVPEGSESIDVKEESVFPGTATERCASSARPKRCRQDRGQCAMGNTSGPAEPPELLEVFVLGLIDKTGSCGPLAGPGAELWGWGRGCHLPPEMAPALLQLPASPRLPSTGSAAAVLTAELLSAVFSAADTSTAT